MRIEYWSIGLRILRDNLLFGVGPDRLYDITPQYMTPGSLKFITTTTMDSPHNWFLSFGCSFGLLALITLMVLLLYPVITYLKKSNLSNFLNNPSAPTFIALLCLLIDSLVSIEQTGLGIWLYFFAGKILASTRTKWVEQENWVENSQQQKEVKVSKASLAIAMSLALISSAVVMNRFTSDAFLRSSIQSVMLKSQAESDYRRIETLAIRLRAEPEYVVQAVPELAKAGDREALLNISKAYFAYNQKSHQARAIRFQVLNAVTSPKNSCPLLPTLIENTAWDRLFVEQYIFCIDQGYFGSEKNSLLQLIEKYIDISFPKTRDNQVSVVNLKARAIYAHLQFQLGKIEIARLLQKQIINDLNTFKNADPNIDVSEVNNHLKF